MNRHALTHARHDVATCLTPGLFRSLRKGERKQVKLDVVYQYGLTRIEFSGPEPLGADDLRVLQGLVAMAGPDGLVLPPVPASEVGRQVRNALEPRWDAVLDNAIVVRGSYRALAHEIGHAAIGGTGLSTIQASIERLWKVSIIVETDGKRRGFRLLSTYTSNLRSGDLLVALNPLIASAVMGCGPFVRINMNEVRALKGDAARLVHQRLCAWINPGSTGRVEMDTLCSYVWPTIAATRDAVKKRRQRVKAALRELVGIGWRIKQYAPNKWAISRPAFNELPV